MTDSQQHSDIPTPPPVVRAINHQRLADYYRIDSGANDRGATCPPARFALAMIESSEATSDNFLTTEATFADACLLAGEEVLDTGRIPDAVYDLDTGERIELHTTTPVVTRSEVQGEVVNPLDGRQGGERP